LVKGRPWWGPNEERKRKIVAELLEGSVDGAQRKGKKLVSIKKAESMFAEALAASCKPDLDEDEVFRLRVLADLAQVYRDLATGYVCSYFVGQRLSDGRLGYEG
jgi:hypothetical protein